MQSFDLMKSVSVSKGRGGEGEKRGKKEKKQEEKKLQRKDESSNCVVIMPFRQKYLDFFLLGHVMSRLPHLFFYNLYIYYKYIKLEYI